MTFGDADSLSGVAARRAAGNKASPHERTMRWVHYGVLLSLSVLMLARVPYSARTMDLSRDVFIAQRILHGESFPLTGPIFSGAFHLGPIWEYALALMLFIGGGSWNGVAWSLGVLIAAQVPLAWLAGNALDGRRTGLMWACALALPSWNMFDNLQPSHPSLVAPLLLAFLLCAIRQWQAPRRRYLLGIALAFILALHAHPASIALTWIGIPVLVHTWRMRRLRFVDGALALLIVFLPVLPFLLWDAMRGFGDTQSMGRYGATLDVTRALVDAWPVFRSVAWDGTLYWLSPMSAWAAQPLMFASIALAAAGVMVALGFARRWRERRDRALLACVIAIVVGTTLATTLLREITPYYMTAPIRVVFCGAVALGLSGLGTDALALASRMFVVIVTLILGIAADVGLARFQTRGALPLAWWPLMDVKHAGIAPTRVMQTPAYAMAASGRFLCGQSSPSIHGGYANQLLLNYAIEMRLVCQRDDVRIGGDDPQRQHWLGLSRAMFAQLDIEPAERIGSMGLVPARPVAAGHAVLPPHTPVYPAYPVIVGAQHEQRLSVVVAPGEYVAVSDIAFILDQGLDVQATIAGRPIQPRAIDGVTRVFDCGDCATSGRPGTVDLTLRIGNSADLDIVVFDHDPH